jgi:cytochrome c oxidase accessory protein FixG
MSSVCRPLHKVIGLKPANSPVVKIIPILAVESSSQVASLYQSEDSIYARSVKGWFSNWRWLMVWATQLVFYGLPWLSINERQAMLFDLGARRFYIFNLVLYPQDLIYLTGLLVISAFALFLFTAVAGRLWCGYACPQTVYTEIFMWVERKIEGDRNARMKLDKSPYSFQKIWRKSSKHAVWIMIGLWTGFTFVGYFTPIKFLASEVLSASLGPWESFWILFYGFATYGNAGWMREQVCKYMCPYARFQSAMFDRDTLIVTYDAQRGEARGSRPRTDSPATYQSKGLGDCIDCGLCVQVCPTGIDIREGLQYECIACSACVDVCNGVMDKMNYSRGLIRNTTQHGLEQGLNQSQVLNRVLRPRVLLYTAILFAICVGLLASLALRSTFKVDVVRDRGTAMLVNGELIENGYRLQIMNATEQEQSYLIAVTGLNGLKIVSPLLIKVSGASARWIPVRLQVLNTNVTAGSHEIKFSIQSQGLRSEKIHEKSVFLVTR